MVFNKNKKGIGFYALIVPITIILMGMMFILKIDPTNNQVSDLEFSQIYKNVDIIGFEKNSNEVFLKSLVDSEFEKLKSTFVDTSYTTSSDKLDNIETDITKKDFLACRIEYDGNPLNIWYNQKNLNTYKNLKVESFDKNQILCLNNYKDNFNDLISTKFSDNLNNILDSQGYTTKVDVIYDDKLKELIVNLEADFSKQTRDNSGKIKNKIKFKNKYSFGEYSNLLFAIQNSLPILNEASKSQVPKCVKDNSNEVDCILTTFKSLIEVEDSGKNILNFYEFKISQINGFNDQDYLALKIDVIEKKTKLEILNFGIVIEDNIPFSLVNFELEDVEKIDNVIKVKIEKPKVDVDKIDKYIIMYSYDNFFNSKSNYPYNDLITELKNRDMPPSSSFYNNYYLTNKRYNLDLIVVNNDGFYEHINKDGEINFYKDINIYQKYNYNIDKFERLETKELFVFVFALDMKNNYYVEEIDGKSRLASPKLKIGPIPLSKEQIQVSGDLKEENLEKSILIKTLNYDSTTFDHYDIYITSKNKGEITKNLGDQKKLVYGCIGIDFECNYLAGESILINKNLNLLITSDVDYITNFYTKSEDEKSKLPFPIFSGNLDSKNIEGGNYILENDKEYDIYVVPVDKYKNNILTRITPAFYFKSLGDVKKNFYVEDNDQIQRTKEIIATPVVIIDNQPPKLVDSFVNLNTISLSVENDGSLKLNYDFSENSDVTKIEGLIKFYQYDEISNTYSWAGNSDPFYIDSNNKIKSTKLDKFIIFKPSIYPKIEISDIKLIDLNRNILLTDLSYEYSG